jgi:hypothetical protein
MSSSLKEILEWQKLLNINGFLPIILFWGGGLIILYNEQGMDWKSLLEQFKNLNAFNDIQIIIFSGILLILAFLIPNIIYELIRSYFVQFLEGNWTFFPLNIFKKFIITNLNFKLEQKRRKRDSLKENYNQLSDFEKEELNKISYNLTYYPKEYHLLPTKFGNLMSSTEEYPKERYSLEFPDFNRREGITGIPSHLWSVLPEKTKSEVNGAKFILLDKIRWIFWIFMFSFWTFCIWIKFSSISPYPIPISIIMSIFFYYAGLIPATLNYCNQVRVVYDLHRWNLYRALNHPRPTSPNDEKIKGSLLSEDLNGGIYTDPSHSYQYYDANEANNEFY